MTPLSLYYVNRFSTGTAQITIYDPTSYASYQAYVDDEFQVERDQNTFLINLNANQKLDVLGLATADSGTDFNASLNDANGDKVRLTLPSSLAGVTVKIYTDNGTGTINYVTPVAVINTANSNLLIESSPLNWDDFTSAEWDTFTSTQWDSFVSDSGVLIVYTSPRLQNGTYKYAVVPYNAAYAGTPSVTTTTIDTRPNEITPSLSFYNNITDVLTINTYSAHLTSYWNVYVGTIGGDQSTVNTTSVYSTGTDSIFVVDGLRTAANGTRWILVREEVGGIEEKNWNWLEFTLVNSNWIGNLPSTPSYLTGVVGVSNAVTLSWLYPTVAIVPDGYYVYSNGGSGAVNYTTPIATVTGRGKGIVTTTVASISATTLFGVRAYKGLVNDGNTITISVVPYGTPVSVTATGTETWKDN